MRSSLRADRARFHETHGNAPISALPQLVQLLRPGICVAPYVAIQTEASPSLLMQAARDSRCSIALPHVTSRSAALRFLAHADADTLVSGPFGLLQPPETAPMLCPDIILTPLLGFTRSGWRLGQGAGHYDRAFLEWPQAMRIGVAFSVQERPELPYDAWDVPLHAVITEREWIEIA
jgi:5-formyltetrahydrofolate cyclo-ligase